MWSIKIISYLICHFQFQNKMKMTDDEMLLLFLIMLYLLEQSRRLNLHRLLLYSFLLELCFHTTPILSWEIIDRARPYRNGSKTCSLCLTEKFHIITSKRQLLNERSELVSTCRHATKFSLKNYKVFPPDHTYYL